MTENGIFIERGAKPPGRWVESEGLSIPVWSGPASWCTRHGAAVMHWLLGRPHAVEGARTDDGRGVLHAREESGRIEWRRKSDTSSDGWVEGSAEIRQDGIVFRDRDDGNDIARRDLGKDLEGDRPFLTRAQDNAFALAFVEHLKRGPYRYRDQEARWTPRRCSASEFVARLRGDVDEYILFEMGGVRPRDHEERDRARLDAEIDRHLLRLGWGQLDNAEQRRERGEALTDLATAETRPKGECPGWAMDWTPRKPAGNLERLWMAAIEGKLERAEYDRIDERMRFGHPAADGDGVNLG